MATIRLVPSTYTRSSTNRVTVTDEANMYNNTDHTGSYASIRGRNSTGNTYYAFIHGFNFDDVPSNAIVSSFSVKIKAYRNSYLSTGSTYRLRLASTPSNNSVISNTTVSSDLGTGTGGTVFTIPTGSLTWEQIKGYGSNFSIEIPLRASSSQYPYAYVYGAEIEVNYTLPTPRNISITDSSTAATVTPTGTQTVYDGDELSITITGISSIDDVIVKDNGVNVNSQIEEIEGGSHSTELHPSSLDSSSGTITDPEDGLSDTSSTSYAQVNANSTSYLMYAFDVSHIPSNATINSVSCSVKASCTRTNGNAGSAQLYAGSTAKGSSYTFGATASTFSLTTGTWTRSELDNIKLRVGSTYTGGSSYYTRFYGADLTINYTTNGTTCIYTLSNISGDHTIVVSDAVHYTVNAVSTTEAATVSPATQSIGQGGDAEIQINTDDIENIIVWDNGDDVTSQVNYVVPSSSGSADTVLGTYTLVSGSFNSGESYFEGLVGKGENGSTTTSNYYSNGSSTIVVFTYDLVFDNIPSNATITRLYARVNGHAESTSNSSEYMCAQLILNTTGNTISDELNFKDVGTSNSTQTVEATTLPTVSQLSGLKLKCRLGYYGGAINGATCYVEYTTPSNPYYAYTIENVSEDHDIEVSDAVTKYQITASSTFNGVHITPTSTMVVEGNMAEFTIDSQNTYSIKLLDNGVDKTSSITGSSGNYKYRIQNVTSAHTLVLSEATYYTVTGSSTYTGATVSAPGKVYAGQTATVTVSVANKYEIVFKDNNVDKTSSLNGSTGTLTYTLTNVQANHTIAVSEATNYTITTSSSYNGVTATANPTKVYAGRSCTITIAGASKDTMTVKDNNTDVTSSLVGSSSPYTYTLNNVSANHTITVAPITYAVNASSTFAGVSITPTSSTVIKGNSVTLTINAPNTYSIRVTDNGAVVTGSLTGSANNYKYTISNVTTAHTVVVSEASYFTVSGSSSYNGATLTVPGKVYAGQNATVTVAVGNKHEIVFKDNNTDKTSSLAGSTGTLTYTLTNVQADHTITVTEASYYTISTSSNYTGATISANPVKVYTGQTTKSSEITLSVGNLYEVVVKDGTTVITSSFTGSNGTFKYTLTNIAANHSITVTEATYYTITTSSTYAPAHISANPTKVYAGRSTTITITGASKNDIIVKDNGVNVTSSLVGSNTTYTYTISNVVASHTVTVEEKPAVTYQVNASSTYSRATITPTASTVVEGDTLVLTITGDVVPIKVTDNNTDVTTSLVTNGSSRTYTLTNITGAHTIVVSFVQTALVRTSSGYVAGKKFYKKTGASTWTEMTLSEFQSYIQSNQTFYE